MPITKQLIQYLKQHKTATVKQIVRDLKISPRQVRSAIANINGLGEHGIIVTYQKCRLHQLTLGEPIASKVKSTSAPKTKDPIAKQRAAGNYIKAWLKTARDPERKIRNPAFWPTPKIATAA